MVSKLASCIIVKNHTSKRLVDYDVIPTLLQTCKRFVWCELHQMISRELTDKDLKFIKKRGYVSINLNNF